MPFRSPISDVPSAAPYPLLHPQSLLILLLLHEALSVDIPQVLLHIG